MSILFTDFPRNEVEPGFQPQDSIETEPRLLDDFKVVFTVMGPDIRHPVGRERGRENAWPAEPMEKGESR